MRKSIIVLVLGALLSHHITTFAQGSSPDEIKLKRKIVELGTEQNVKIKLQSKETLRGRVSEIKEDVFVLNSVSTSGQVSKRGIAYAELRSVSRIEEDTFGKVFKQSMAETAGRAVIAGIGMIIFILVVKAAN